MFIKLERFRPKSLRLLNYRKTGSEGQQKKSVAGFDLTFSRRENNIPEEKNTFRRPEDRFLKGGGHEER
jgi:hypothetical protein